MYQVRHSVWCAVIQYLGCLQREKHLFTCHHALRSLTTLAHPASTLAALIKTTTLCHVESEWYGVTNTCSENNRPVTCWFLSRCDILPVPTMYRPRFHRVVYTRLVHKNEIDDFMESMAPESPSNYKAFLCNGTEWLYASLFPSEAHYIYFPS